MSLQQPQTILRDYRHAARIYTDSNYRLSPKYGFLFYVEFDFNPLITEISNQAAQELGMIVKSVSLPKFTIETKVHNAYNRKNIVQNKINYDPVTISFRDDQADNVKQFWYDYYSYFYRDPDYADATYAAQHKYQSRPSFDWGYSPRPAVGYNNANGTQPYQYIQAIRIYSLYQGNFSEYQLVNPIITSFKHGEHDVSANEFLHTDMTVQYETVKYLEGYVTTDTVGGFMDLHYDNTPSPNGGTPQSQTNSSQITDLANNQTAINPGLQSSMSLNAASGSASASVPSLLNQVTTGMAGAGTGGGYSIPNLGSLTQGVTGSAVLSQQLQSAGIGLVGSATSTLATGLTGAVAKGLGPNGGTILGLAASAIANPNQALKTVENMATALVMGVGMNMLNQAITSGVQSLSSGITSGIQSGLGKLDTTLAFGDSPGATLSGQLGAIPGNFGQSVNNLLAGNGFMTDQNLIINGTGINPYLNMSSEATSNMMENGI
jgi:hypothetical protein